MIQATLCARMFVIASMAPTAPVASMVAPMALMVLTAWVDLMAPELKNERERKKCTGLGAHLLHPTLRFKPFVLLLVRGPHGTVLLMSLHPDATLRENDGSRSLRRVVKN